MALRRMICLGEISQLCQRQIVQHKFPKNARNFKRNRGETKIENETIQTPFTNLPVTTGPVPLTKLWKPLGFTIAFSSSCFVGAAIWQYENMRSHALRMMKKPMGWFQKKLSPYKSGSIRREVNAWWNGLSQAEKLFVPICAVNVLVFLAWRIPRFQPTMLKYFCSNPASQIVCWPMLLSTFSHYSGLHILANMYVLHSFSSGAVDRMGKEQFLGLYLSAGVISSFTSYMYKVFSNQPGLSLGASGAIMAILGYVCTQYPDTKLGIIFLPFFTFPAETAIKFIVGFDLVGLIMGWKIFDHAAHLGGAACGIAWCYWGNEYIWQKREGLLHHWHKLRGAPQK